MIINTNSWHYRLIKKFDIRHPTSLCPYFWKTVWCCVMSTFIIAFCTAAITFVGYLYGATTLAQLSGLSTSAYIASLDWYMHPLVVLASLTCTALTLLFVGFVCYLIIPDLRQDVNEAIYDKFLPKKLKSYEDYSVRCHILSRNKRNKAPNMIKAFFKARKEKICPTLEFK